MAFNPKSIVLTFIFENDEAAKQFKSWLCGQGEQDYWTWMYEQECKQEGNITGLSFDYTKGGTIPVRCGRLDKK